MSHPLFVGMYLAVLLVLIIAIHKKSKPLLAVSLSLVLANVVLSFIMYPTIVRDTDKNVTIDTEYIIPLDGEDPESDDANIESWAKVTDNTVTVLVQINDQLAEEQTYDAADVMFSPNASILWENFDGNMKEDNRPRVSHIECKWSNGLVRLLEGRCNAGEKSTVIHIPGAYSVQD